MNATNQNTVKALRAVAPTSIKMNGRTFKHSGCLFSDEKSEIRWDYTARKQRGAFMGSKISAKITYNQALDLYDIEITHFDGMTLDSEIISDWSNCTWESFAAFGLA